jgi:hypothetical protein
MAKSITGDRKPANRRASSRKGGAVKRRWRDYRTEAGRRPVAEALDGLSDDDAASVIAAMADVRDRGLEAARHLQDEIWEVRADGDRVIYRVLFATQGARKPDPACFGGIRKEDAEDASGENHVGEAPAARLEAAWRGEETARGFSSQIRKRPISDRLISNLRYHYRCKAKRY